ncbi:hypothetical protein [Acetobacter indonesiensis]|uniref:hypothetical protein n=1 Tax=Acetobacter indonesiensis TaxID=104101 RepID=UPI0020A3F632|nr:hypothetical protein [Acetobacter indonesiensis]MCP1231716.1 hypothetical protein [Acetobacter indonesiensis]
MAAQLGNYVLETATAPGTGSFILNGPATDRRSFTAAFPNGGSVFYFADDGSSAEWGVGTLTIGTPSTLSRTTIIGTTSGGASALNFSGAVEVYNEIPAEFMPILEADGRLIVKEVSDWTQRQALGASDADGRYVKGIGNPATDQRILSLAKNKNDGGVYIKFDDQTIFRVGLFGDYATNSVVNDLSGAVVKRDVSQGPSVSTFGIVSQSGQPFCVDSAGVLRYLVKSPGSTPTDVPIQSVGINHQRIYVAYDNDRQAAWLVRSPAEGSSDTRVGAVGIANGVPYFAFGGDNDAANPLWLAKSADTLTLAQYAADFATSDPRVIPISGTHILQCFSVNVGNGSTDGSWVVFPQAFSGPPVYCSANSNGNGDAVTDTDYWCYGPTTTGVYVRPRNHIGNSYILAIGPK